MKKIGLLLICMSLVLGACATEKKEPVSTLPIATAITFTSQEQDIANMTFGKLVGINFQNYTQGSVFIWAIDEGKVVQEYLIPQYSSPPSPMARMLVGFHMNPANLFTYDVTTAFYQDTDSGQFMYSLTTEEAKQAWCEGEFDTNSEVASHLYQPEEITLDGKYHVLAAFWVCKELKDIDEEEVFTIHPDESLTDFFNRVSENSDIAYVIMAEVGATSPL